MMKCIFSMFLLMMYALVSCTSSSSSSSPKEAVQTENNEEDEDGQEESPKEAEVSTKRKSALKNKAALEKLYRIDLVFESLRNAFVQATQAKPNDFSIYTYDLDYELFPDNTTSPTGQAEVLAKNGQKTYVLDQKGKSRARKHLYIGTATKSGYCGACFADMDQIHLVFGLAYFEKPGPSSGFFSLSLRFLKGSDRQTYVAVDLNPNLQTQNRVTGVTMKKDSLEILYVNPAGDSVRLQMKLNATLDTDVFVKGKSSKDFRRVAKYYGGSLPEYATRRRS